jgi:hypothetical protein
VKVFPGLLSVYCFDCMAAERLTELTSGAPLDPASARSGVVEALDGFRRGIYCIAGCADVGVGVVVVAIVGITTTTVTITT